MSSGWFIKTLTEEFLSLIFFDKTRFTLTTWTSKHIMT